MVSFKDFDESKMAEYSTEELRGFVREIELKKSVIQEHCSSELAEYLKNDKFDPYSSSGSRKLKKVAEKYTPSLMGANEFLKVINVELKKREQYQEEMRYSGRSIKKNTTPVSEEEFLKTEEDKTWAYRSKIE